MKYLFIIALLFISSCDDEKKLPAGKTGYDYYLEVCEYDGETEGVCTCRGAILKKYLSDAKILQFASATILISQGKKEESDKIIEKNPEIVTALSKLSEESKSCDTLPAQEEE